VNIMTKNSLIRAQSVSSKRVVKFNAIKTKDSVSNLNERKTKSASILELNQRNKALNNNNNKNDFQEESIEVFVFEDRTLYRKYLDICRQRDEIPRSLPQR
jgi:hypothetical protein